MNDADLFDACVKVTGAFESGTLSYDRVVGNFDGSGISAGVLQWNAGQGTLQSLVAKIGTVMGWEKARAFFHASIQEFSTLSPKQGIAFAKAHFLDGENLTSEAKQSWTRFLQQPESIQVQRETGAATELHEARELAEKYCPQYKDRSRVIAFFFDLANQQGSMKHLPVISQADTAPALKFAVEKDHACAEMWAPIVAADPLAALLLDYGFARAREARAAYIWDCLSRRGSIAARIGIVHGKNVDLRAQLD